MKYSPEQKKQLLQAYHNGETITNLCLKHNLNRSTFYNWLQAEKKAQELVLSQPITATELRLLKLRLQKLEKLVEILQQVEVSTQAPLRERLKALEKIQNNYDVHSLCEALKVDRGTFYNHIKRAKKENASHQIRRTALSHQIKEIHEASNQIYGAKKIRAILVEQGVRVSDKFVGELMEEMNLESIRKNSKALYSKKHSKKKKNLLKMQFDVKKPNEVWVSDVTYFKYGDRFYYICAILDLYGRKVIAHKISAKHSTQLISATFKLAYETRNRPENLMFHSDRGTQYTSHTFQKLLADLAVKQSFSPSGSPQHNAVMESFFSTLKKEELYRIDYRSVSELKARVTAFMDFYNKERSHSTLQYKTPNAYELQYFEKKKVNPSIK